MAASLGVGLGAVGGYMKYREGQKMQQNAQRAIDSFKWQELNNPYKNLSVSTMGSDLQREENARANATVMQGLRGAGTRGVIGGAPGLVEGSNEMNRRIAADLDAQRKDIDMAAAADDTRIRDMQENRQANELAGYGQMLNVGRQDKFGGVTDIMNAAFAQNQFGQATPEMGGNDVGLSGMVSGMGRMMGRGPSSAYPKNTGYNDPNAYKAQYYGTRVV